jgi:DNA-binding transcriptional LysR family regulator
MEMRQLKYFVTVAEELNFRRAATRLFMEQPPLSRQIRLLEDEISVELFHRGSKGVTLTSAGQSFLKEARLTLAQAERAIEIAQKIDRSQQLTIGFSLCAYNVILPILQVYRQQFPDVILTLTEMSNKAQIQALLNNAIDIGFIYATTSYPDLLTATLYRESLLVALPPRHPLTHQKQINLRSLANELFIFFTKSEQPELYAQTIELCQESGFSPNIIKEGNSSEIILGVASGLGIAFVPSDIGSHPQGGITYHTLTTPTPILEISAAWNRESSSNSAIEKFSTLLK